MSNRLTLLSFVILITMLLAAKSFSEVKVAILDSGCNIEYQEGISFIDEDITDLNGHGTSIAKIIKDIIPMQNFTSLSILNHNGYSVDIEASRG